MDLRLRVATGVAVAAVGTLFALPAPPPLTPPAASAPQTTGPPVPLETAWPAAVPGTIPGAQPDGSTFLPLLVLGPDLSTGMSSGAGRAPAYVLRSPAGIRELSPNVTGMARSLDAYTSGGGQLFWFLNVKDISGGAHQTLWTADVAGGESRVLAADTGTPRLRGGSLDLQVVDGVVRWVAEGPGGDTEVRSVPVTGGAVAVARYPGKFVLSQWPWGSPAVSTSGSSVELLNFETRAKLKVPAAKGRNVNCGPVWCRSTDDATLELRRVDGTDVRPIGGREVGLIGYPIGRVRDLDIFTGAISNTMAGPVRPLIVYDIAGHRSVLVSAVAGAVGARGDFLLWSTGDNEGMVWHFLDLRTLRS
ncbi:hypothetical protein AB0M43_03000 [Longispora sp. NPDC051575]|uniref:hypothetical protein n=1 Tax=Longispora sp. NPDC051575 TaxID=3154943 RepID=UPI00343B63CB